MPQRSSSTGARPCKPIFTGLVFVLSGDFGGPARSHSNIERWVNNHSGNVEKEVTETTTHLVCSIDNFKRKVPAVKKALALGVKCKIVSWEYIEDCLTGPGTPKKISEKPYQLKAVMARHRNAEKLKVVARAKFDQEIESSKELVDKFRYHTYRDDTFFEYNIVLTRVTWHELTDKLLTDKYTLTLFQSNAEPYSYMVGGKLRCGHKPTALYRKYCTPMMFDAAFAAFKTLFKYYTGIEWDQRCDELPQSPNMFRYSVPTGGKVVGVLPFGWAPRRKPDSGAEKAEESRIVGNGAVGGLDTDGPGSEGTLEGDRDGGMSEGRGLRRNPYTPGVSLGELIIQGGV